MSNFRSKLNEGLFWLGPVLAGFNVASHIIAFFGIGAVASWFIEKWFPLTRLFWIRLFDRLELPEIGLIEQDALTTLAFFTPLGIWALLKWEDEDLNAKYKTAGSISGILFLLIVSQDFFSNVFLNALKYFYSLPIIGYLAIGFLFPFVAKYIADSTKFNWSGKGAEETLVLSRVTETMTDIEMRKIGNPKKVSRIEADLHFDKSARNNFNSEVQVKYIINIFTNLIYLVVFGSAILFAASIGVVTAYCLVLIVILSYSAIVFSPFRLCVTLGVVIGFVVSGLAYDVVIWLIGFISLIDASELAT